MIKKVFLLFYAATVLSYASYADEGMWLPILLEQLNQSDMQNMGLKLTSEDIYSINKSSLKDAVCLFGGGCTAEVVSEQGLILTNYHCGYSTVKSHSTLENDYLTDGYWAQDFKEELSNTGLSVTFLIKMEDVTVKTLEGVTATITENQRNDIITKNIEKIEKEAVKGTHYKAKVKPFYYGNEYYLFITEVFTDIRLVGAPPSAIGKFGGDTDNWMWPRHTGDFAIFRIYADKNNEPADYSENNVPYKPKQSLAISLKGVKKGDFTMVYGFPGRTQEYLTSYGVNLIGNIEDPVMTGIRFKKLKIMETAMKENLLIKFQYSAKYVNIANYWKKWIGESKGLKNIEAIEKKKKLEQDFTIWANADNFRKVKYGKLISAFEKVYSQYAPIALACDYFIEAGAGIEIIKYAWGYNNLILKSIDKSMKDEDINNIVVQLKNGAKSFFKNYDLPTEKKIFTVLLKIYFENAELKYLPEIFTDVIKNKFKGDIEKYTDYFYKNSSFTSEVKALKMLDNFKRKKAGKIAGDPAFILASAIYNNYFNNIMPLYNQYDDQFDSLYRIYITGLREMMPDKKFYPDANSTLRLTYGKADDYKPMDAADYYYFTTLDGIMQKEDPTIEDYQVPAKLKELYKNKDYGRYSTDSIMHVAFIATNHTTGGNSGSPVLNGKGQLIGINFDRVWEGTMSDIMFDPDRCRNISLDIRYALFIIDKFAGAKRLIDEMKIVE
ncbi:MAG: S46 family peptidase [Bacteroidales bacterium]